MTTYFRVHRFTDGSTAIYLNLGDKMNHEFSLESAKRMLAELEMAIKWYEEATGR